MDNLSDKVKCLKQRGLVNIMFLTASMKHFLVGEETCLPTVANSVDQIHCSIAFFLRKISYPFVQQDHHPLEGSLYRGICTRKRIQN